MHKSPDFIQNQEQTFHKHNNTFNNVRSSQIFYNIADQDMNEFFMNYIQYQQKQQKTQQKQQFLKQNQNQFYNTQQTLGQNQAQQIKKQLNSNQVVTRLDIQIKKNGLNLITVYGQIFIMLIDAQLVCQQKKQKGKLLITNYRLIFYKKHHKKLDIPYGFISQCKLNDKLQQIIIQLKYNHYWKIKILQNKNFQNITIFLQIYLKIDNIKSCFAFSYALKYPEFNKIKHHQIINQFVRLGCVNNNDIGIIDNTSFQLCSSYPQIIYVPVKYVNKSVGKIVHFWNQNRFPILVYQHNGSKNGTIWRSSNLICQRTQDLKDIAKYFQLIRKNNQKLLIFDSGYKSLKKSIEQYEVNSQCQIKYLEIDSLQSIKLAYVSMVQCFLIPKKSFIKDLLASKWYDGVISYLKGAVQIAKNILNNHNVIIKCNNGKDKSAVLSALVQIIINPYYRTFHGFSVLIQKQFLFLGHPFLNRLGLTSNKQQQFPIFIMFLDCVSQLIYTNQMCFQYNYKYLSKLSNLMYTCLFGTFITNSRKQSLTNNISTQTVPIWNQLISQLTHNAYYYQKSGILEVPIKFDDLRIWKQHFWYLTTPPKESYKIHPSAQNNLDYINLNCHKVMEENRSLQNQISQQKKIIDVLKAKIQAKLQAKSKTTI